MGGMRGRILADAAGIWVLLASGAAAGHLAAAESRGSPFYFIAVHCEPYHNLGGLAQVARAYAALRNMVAAADTRGVKLTLMFSAPWASYIGGAAGRRREVAQWRASGHEIAGHHHGLDHGNWDGYSDYGPHEIARRRADRDVWPPEPRLGTLADFTRALRRLDPGIKAGCMNDAADRDELPDAFVHDTCLGYANFGPAGTALRDFTAAKGRNDYVSVGSHRGIERWWLAHSWVPADPKVAEFVASLPPTSVYGAVFHSDEQEMLYFREFLRLVGRRDPAGARSRTVSEVIEQKLLPEKRIASY